MRASVIMWRLVRRLAPGEGLLPAGAAVAYRHVLHDRLRQWGQSAGAPGPVLRASLWHGPLCEPPPCTQASVSCLALQGSRPISKTCGG
jgi:hypothetical protein